MADHVDFMADLCCFDVFTRGRFLTSEQSAFQEHSLTYGERKETRGQSLLIFFWISGCTTYYGKKKKKKREKKKERKSGIWIICPLWISKCLPYHLSVFQFPWLEGHLWWWRVKIKYQSLVARAWVCFPHQVSLKIIKLWTEDDFCEAVLVTGQFCLLLLWKKEGLKWDINWYTLLTGLSCT